MPLSFSLFTDELQAGKASRGAMIRRILDFDWSATPAGRIDTWPDDLRSVCRTMLLSSTPMLVLVGGEGIVIHNDAVRSMLGPAAEGLLGKPITEAPPDLARFGRQALATAFERRPSGFRDWPETLVRDSTEDSAWFDLDVTPIPDAHGRILGALVVSIETTKRMQALTDLQHSRERLDAALNAGGIVGTWEVDFTTETVWSDERYARLHGVDPELAKVGANKDLFVAGIHPDSRKRVMEAFDKAKIDGEYRCIHRVVGHGETRWIIASGRVRHSSEGAPLSFAGVVVDITEQIEAALDAVQQSEERFARFFRLTPVPTAISTYSDCRLLDVNDAFVAVFGLTAEELVGKLSPELPIWVSTASRQTFERELKASARSRRFETQLRTRYGEILDCLVSVEKVTVDDEECKLIAIQDITERKRTEVELVEAIEAVMKDTSWFSQSIIEKLANLRRPDGPNRPSTKLSDLTLREREVLGLICRGRSDAEIAEALNLTRNTVRNHVARIYSKADVHSRAAAVVWARERGFIGSAKRPAPDLGDSRR